MRTAIVVGCLAITSQADGMGSSPAVDRTAADRVVASETWLAAAAIVATPRPVATDISLRAQARQAAGDGNAAIDSQQQAVVAALSSASITFSARLAYASSSASSIAADLQTSLESVQASASAAIASVQASASSAVANAGVVPVAATMTAAATASMTDDAAARTGGTFGACSPPEVALAVAGIIMGAVGLLSLMGGLFLFFRARSMRNKMAPPRESEADITAAAGSRGAGNSRRSVGASGSSLSRSSSSSVSNQGSHAGERRDGPAADSLAAVGSVKDKRRRWQVHGGSLASNTKRMVPATAAALKANNKSSSSSSSGDISLVEYRLPDYTRMFPEASPTKSIAKEETSEVDQTRPATASKSEERPVDGTTGTAATPPRTAAAHRAATVFKPAAVAEEDPRPTSSLYEPFGKQARAALAAVGNSGKRSTSMAITTTASPTTPTLNRLHRSHSKSDVGVPRRETNALTGAQDAKGGGGRDNAGPIEGTSHRLTSPGGSEDSLAREYQAFASQMAPASTAEISGNKQTAAGEVEGVGMAVSTPSSSSASSSPPASFQSTEQVGVAVSTPTNVAVRSPKTAAVSETAPPESSSSAPSSTATATSAATSPTEKTPRRAPPAGALPGLPADGLPRRTKTVTAKGETADVNYL